MSSGELKRKSNAFLQDIENGKYIGIVATNTITEYLAVTKRILFQKNHRQLSLNDISKILGELERLINHLGIAVYDSDDLVVNSFGKSTLFSEIENLIRNYPCRIGARDQKAHSLCGADAMSVVFATRIGVNLYATFDEDFKDLKNGINPLMVWEKY
jgi:predicted nucleic acid-binding protein